MNLVGDAQTQSTPFFTGAYDVSIVSTMNTRHAALVSPHDYYCLAVSIVKCILAQSDLGVKRKYDQLHYLTASRNAEISRLSIIVKDLEERLEVIEKNQHDLMDKIDSMETAGHPAKSKERRISRYSCDMCSAKFRDSKHLQLHRKNAHKAPYNI